MKTHWKGLIALALLLCALVWGAYVKSVDHATSPDASSADSSPNDPRGVFAQHIGKLRDILARLDAARVVADMDMPSFRLHQLKGEYKGVLGCNRSRKLAGDFSL